MQISIKYVFSYLLFKYYTDAVRPLFVTEKFEFIDYSYLSASRVIDISLSFSYQVNVA